MKQIDKISFERKNIIWDKWQEICEIAGSWECLKRIHVILFDGIFEFAGKIRKVNISKGGFRFANYIFLDTNIPLISQMPQRNYKEILEKYIEMNIAHPFREGNGRAMRLWLDSMFEKELAMRVDWSKISREDYLSAMQRSPVNSLELDTLLTKNMISGEKLKDKFIFFSGLSASYSYEK